MMMFLYTYMYIYIYIHIVCDILEIFTDIPLLNICFISSVWCA
jgi:hypothetical protein